MNQTGNQELTFGFSNLPKVNKTSRRMEIEVEETNRELVFSGDKVKKEQNQVKHTPQKDQRREYQPRYQRSRERSARGEPRGRNQTRSVSRNRGRCHHKFNCDWGLDCRFHHTQQEIELFESENRRKNDGNRGRSKPRSENRNSKRRRCRFGRGCLGGLKCTYQHYRNELEYFETADYKAFRKEEKEIRGWSDNSMEIEGEVPRGKYKRKRRDSRGNTPRGNTPRGRTPRREEKSPRYQERSQEKSQEKFPRFQRRKPDRSDKPDRKRSQHRNQERSQHRNQKREKSLPRNMLLRRQMKAEEEDQESQKGQEDQDDMHYGRKLRPS
jgi:hypothetical protein